MSKILIYHHLGLGDHFMCHGIVREYCKKYDKVGLFCLPHNFSSVSFMYKDLKNLEIIKGDDNFAREYIKNNQNKNNEEKYDEVKIIGFENLNRLSQISLERQFYKIAGVDIEKKWSSFYVERDYKKEEELYKKIIDDENYVFIHEDNTRNFSIEKNKIDKKYKLITADKKMSDNVFDYCTIIERAKEIHVIDSSFMFLIDCLPYENKNQKLFVHRYARENSPWKLPILKKDWHIYLFKNYSFGILVFIKDQIFYKIQWLIEYIKSKF